MSAAMEERYVPVVNDELERPILDERVRDEVETLKSIFMDDLVIRRVEDRPEIIETVIRPSTGCNVDQQYVCVTLEVTLPARYPDRSPIVMLRNPRGLDDDLLETLNIKIDEMLAGHLGTVVIYSIVELLQDYLTISNLPNGCCAICLFSFSEGDAFIKTDCYHYFHKHCLANHLESSKQNYEEEYEKLPNWKRMEAAPFQQTCPVCRSVVFCDVETLKEAPPPIEAENAAPFELTPELRALQKKMAALLRKQEAKGGVVGTGDNGPPPLTITTPADFADGAGSSGMNRGRNARQPANNASIAPMPMSAPCGSRQPIVNIEPASTSTAHNRGSASRRGATHPGPQNINTRKNGSNNTPTRNSPTRGGFSGNPFRVPPPPGPMSPANASFSANRGAIASGNAGRGVISTAPPEVPSPAVEAPGSPSGRPAYRGPYRGFNRRPKPGRRGQNSR